MKLTVTESTLSIVHQYLFSRGKPNCASSSYFLEKVAHRSRVFIANFHFFRNFLFGTRILFSSCARGQLKKAESERERERETAKKDRGASEAIRVRTYTYKGDFFQKRWGEIVGTYKKSGWKSPPPSTYNVKLKRIK